MNNDIHPVIRWGIIGCGDVTEVKSGPAFSKVEGSQLVAVMRRDEEKAQDYARRHGVPKYYSSADALINDPEVDAVYVATPPDSHKAYALRVAAANKICCVEKPMAMNRAECREMVTAFERINKPLFVAYYRRSLPRYLQVKSWLDNGKIGEIRHVDWTLCRPPTASDLAKKPNWRNQPDIAGGGYFIDLACHGLDLLSFLISPFDRVCGYGINQLGFYRAEDAVTASWTFKNGATGKGCWNFGSFDEEELVTLYGSKGKITFSLFDDKPITLRTAEENLALNIKHPEHIQYVHILNMIKHIRGEITHPSLGKNGAEVSWVMDRILGRAEE